MRRLLLSCVVGSALLIGAPTAMTGCAHSGSAVTDNAINYATGEQLYVTTVRTVTSLASTGRITLAQAERFDQARVACNNILNRWRASVQAGEAASLQASFESALAELIRIEAEAKGGPQ